MRIKVTEAGKKLMNGGGWCFLSEGQRGLHY